jgi:two-component system phosphate regulon sensor histidine kinase PhoR
MVGNYLDLAKLEGGELRFDPEADVDLTALVGRAVELVEENARERGSAIRVETPDRPVLLATADPGLLNIVLVNLIDNAVKYGYDEIEVRVTLALEDGAAVLTVRNPGVGFTEKQAAKLFRRFSRLKQKGTEDRRGTGLGLYLTWWALQQHEGSITPRSEPGEWAEFTVRLPGARLG